jgi:hypothetical protein
MFAPDLVIAAFGVVGRSGVPANKNRPRPRSRRPSLPNDALQSRSPQRALRGRLFKTTTSMEPLLRHSRHCHSALRRKLDCYPPEVLQTCPTLPPRTTLMVARPTAFDVMGPYEMAWPGNGKKSDGNRSPLDDYRRKLGP